MADVSEAKQPVLASWPSTTFGVAAFVRPRRSLLVTILDRIAAPLAPLAARV